MAAGAGVWESSGSAWGTASMNGVMEDEVRGVGKPVAGGIRWRSPLVAMGVCSSDAGGGEGGAGGSATGS